MDREEQKREKGRKETRRSETSDDKAGIGWIHHTAGMWCSDTYCGLKAVGNEHYPVTNGGIVTVEA